MSLLSFFLRNGGISACFNSERNSPLSEFSATKMAIRSLFSLMILVGISICWQDYLMLRLLIIFSISLQLVFLKWKVESSALALILTIHVYLSKALIRYIIGSRLSLTIGKDLGFCMFKVSTTFWLYVSQSSSSLDMVLPSSTR